MHFQVVLEFSFEEVMNYFKLAPFA